MSSVTEKVQSLTKKQGIFKQIKEDVLCVFDRDPAARNLAEVLITYPGVHAVILHRCSHLLWKKQWYLAARLISAFNRLVTNVDIHPGAIVGRRFFIDHGAGVVIGETTVVGNDVTMYHGTTLGGTSWNSEKRHPTIADGVLIGAGAKVLGPIHVGQNVRIGSNSIVNKDVPACSTVVGIPGRVVRRRDLQIDDNRGINLDHHEIPDPVGKAISCLIDRIELLEKQLAKHELDNAVCTECESESLCDPETPNASAKSLHALGHGSHLPSSKLESVG